MPRKKTNEEYKQQCEPFGVEPLEEYKGIMTKIKHRCDCGNDNWITTPQIVLRGLKCGCANPFKVKTHEQYAKQLAEERPEIKVLGRYINTHTPILHLCKCGKPWTTEPAVVLSQKSTCGCEKGLSRRLSQEEYESRIESLGVKLLAKYQSLQRKVLHRCICGFEWEVRPDDVLQGKKCGCIKSQGEEIIKSYLTEKEISFSTEKTFKDLRGKKYPLKFDVAIYDKNKLICLVECNGEQHYRFIKNIHKTLDDFKLQQKYDRMKRQYAKKKGIPFIELIYISRKQETLIPSLEIELKALGIKQLPKRKYEQLSMF